MKWVVSSVCALCLGMPLALAAQETDLNGKIAVELNAV